MTGVDGPFSGNVPLTVAACSEGNAAQQFSYMNSTQYPFMLVAQGDGVISTSGSSMVLSGAQIGLGIETCNPNSGDQFSFSGSGSTAGQLMHGGLCVDGSCQCYPLPLVACNAGDSNQLWTLTSGRALVNSASGQCLDIYGGVVRDGDI